MANSHKKTKTILNDNWDKICKLKEKGMSLGAISRKYKVSYQVLFARFKKTNPDTVLSMAPRVLVLDIESAPMLSYTWGLWQQNINPAMRVEDNRSYMMTIAMKWLGENEVFYLETRTEDDSKLVRKVLAYLDEADFVIGHNAKKFDMKKINAYAILNGLNPPSPYKVIDTMLMAKQQFSFERNTLAYLSNALCTETKSGHGKFQGFSLWSECMKGNEEAWAEMKHYNIQDIKATEELYMKLRPWAKGHPNMVTTSDSYKRRCTVCSSSKVHKHGFSRTNVSKFQMYKCDSCGSFSRDRKNLLSKEVKEVLLTSIPNG